MTAGSAQADLFGTAGAGADAGADASPLPPGLPAGFLYRDAFISVAEEAALLETFVALPLDAARYKSWTARRRIASFGTEYDADRGRVVNVAPLPASLAGLQVRCAAWAGLTPEAFSNALVTEYGAGTPLGWHRDAPIFEVVVGVSLGGTARMRLRRYPPVAPKKADVLSVELAPRSAYVLRDDVRWNWQHAIAPTPALRWSVTFRTQVAARRSDRDADGR